MPPPSYLFELMSPSIEPWFPDIFLLPSDCFSFFLLPVYSAFVFTTGSGSSIITSSIFSSGSIGSTISFFVSLGFSITSVSTVSWVIISCSTSTDSFSTSSTIGFDSRKLSSGRISFEPSSSKPKLIEIPSSGGGGIPVSYTHLTLPTT